MITVRDLIEHLESHNPDAYVFFPLQSDRDGDVNMFPLQSLSQVDGFSVDREDGEVFLHAVFLDFHRLMDPENFEVDD